MDVKNIRSSFVFRFTLFYIFAADFIRIIFSQRRQDAEKKIIIAYKNNISKESPRDFAAFVEAIPSGARDVF